MKRKNIVTSQDVIEALDKARGDVPLSRWVTRHFEDLLNIPKDKRVQYK